MIKAKGLRNYSPGQNPGCATVMNMTYNALTEDIVT